MIRPGPWLAYLFGMSAASALTSGCASGPAPHAFLLGTALRTGADPAQTATLHIAQLQTVRVPDYLDSEDILVRQDGNELLASATGHWAERLSAGIGDALSRSLASRLPDYWFEPARPLDRSARQIVVDIEAFDVWRDGRCALSASWLILDPDAGSVPVSGRAVFDTAAGSRGTPLSDAALVAAMAASVDRLAEALDAALGLPAVTNRPATRP